MIKKTFLARLVFDFIAAVLMLVALAYYWLDNVAHEWVGTGLFALLMLHNVINRRWYGRVRNMPREPRHLLDLVLTLALLATMLALLTTSVMISRTVFGFLHIEGGFTVRQIHLFVAYWCVVLVAIHLGLRWRRVLVALRSACGISDGSVVGTVVLRLFAGAIAAQGLRSFSVLEAGTKLSFQMSLDGWDFQTSTAAFFLHWTSIVGLFASITHYLACWLQALQRKPSLVSD